MNEYTPTTGVPEPSAEKAPAPADDEREALIEDRKAVLDVLNQGRGLPLEAVSAQVMMVLSDRGFRRSEVPEPSAEDRDPITDENLWDFADDLLDAWNIEDTNAPSLAEDFRDRFVARFHPAYRGEPQGEPTAHDRDRDGICRRCGRGITAAEVLGGETPCEPQGEPSDVQVHAALSAYWGAMNVDEYGSVEGMRAALRAAWCVT